MNAYRSIVLLAAILGLCACGSDKDDDKDSDEDSEDVGPPSGAVCPTGSTVTFDKDIQPIITMYCIRCHSVNVPAAQRMGAPSDHNFDTEQGVLDAAKHIDESAAAGPNATNTMMPPNGAAPSLEERQKLGEYLACHAAADAGT
ncbi:MAG TPA: hypothetical protein VG963_34075 [Polyangiaceae bacterium]|nr:hypothetical protein [Polyangiaceae bacterium]